MKIFSIISRLFIGYSLLLLALTSHPQTSNKNGIGISLKNIFKPSRIEDAHYRLIMYNQNSDTLSGLTVMDRQIKREDFNSTPCIKITETNLSSAVRNKVIIYMDAKTLKPQYFESYIGDTLIQKATFEDRKMTLYDIKNGAETKSESIVSENMFLSNSFSELVQSNDFGKNPVVNFETFTPGRATNQFMVKRVGEKEFSIPGQKNIACWLLKFTRIDSNGIKSSAGFRYVDKKSGKVVMFKSDIESNTFFTYQMIFLQ